MWERARRILDIMSESARRNHQEGRGGLAAYNGFLFCDECGRGIQGYVRIADMEEKVETLLTEQMTDPAFLRRLLMRLKANDADSKRASQVQHLKAERASLEKKRSRVIDMYVDGEISKDERSDRLARVAMNLGRVNEELARLDSTPVMTENQLVEMFRVFASFDTLPKEDRRKLLSLYIPRMRVRDGEVVALFRLLDNAETRYDKKCSKN